VSVRELINLRGRRALITGVAGSLGRVIADTLAELGADLILVDRFGSDMESLGRLLVERWNVGIQLKVCDLEQQHQRTELMNWVKQGGQKLNILVNNAAFVGNSELPGWGVPFQEQTVETWRRALEVNLTAVFDLCQGFTPIMGESEGANMINISSIYGVYGPDWDLYEGTGMSNPAAYGASKGGVIQLTRWLATTIAPKIRVNAVSPGGIFRHQPESFVRKYNARTPLGRMASEEDFRGVVAYLATDMSKYVTGQNIVVDGGWGVW